MIEHGATWNWMRRCVRPNGPGAIIHALQNASIAKSVVEHAAQQMHLERASVYLTSIRAKMVWVLTRVNITFMTQSKYSVSCYPRHDI